MFEAEYGKPLSESLFEEWLEKGRESKVGYKYLLVNWNAHDEDFQAIYVAERSEIILHKQPIGSPDSLVAAYDIYSESRIHVEG
ncbi:MAG: hypothetical protein ACI8QD_001920 [Cyclobacteriaceae bacterium]|jgi:hypothetical protein